MDTDRMNEILTEVFGGISPNKINEREDKIIIRYHLDGHTLVKKTKLLKKDLPYIHDYNFVNSSNNHFSITLEIRHRISGSITSVDIDACRGESFEVLDSELKDSLVRHIKEFVEDGISCYFCEKVAA